MVRRPQRSALGVALAALGVLMAGCAEPTTPDSEPVAGAEAPATAETLTPLREELIEELAGLHAAVGTIRSRLEAVVGAGQVREARTAAESAIDAFLDVPTDTVGGLLPSAESVQVRGGDGDDAVTTTLNAARRIDGDLGRSVVEVIRDPIVGDLGALERDPAGVIAQAREATEGAGSVSAAVDAVGELPGEALRALAWTQLAARTPSLTTAREAAERADAHLGVVHVALEIVSRQVEESGDADDVAASPITGGRNGG